MEFCIECGHPRTDHEASSDYIDGQVWGCLLIRVNRTNDPDDHDRYTQCPCWFHGPWKGVEVT